MNGYENETELMDYLKVIWKRKWFIVIPTFFCIIVALVFSLLLPPKWEVDALIQPSKFLKQTKKGKIKDVLLIDFKQIAGQIDGGFYNNLIASELNMDIRKLPKFKTENLKDTNLVRVSIREKDVEKAKLFLNSLLKHLKEELDEKTKIELKRIKTMLNSDKKENSRIEQEIKAYYKNELNSIRQRKEYIEKEIGILMKRTEKSEKEQHLSLKEKKGSEFEYLTTLVELLKNTIKAEENIKLELKDKKNTSHKLKKRIHDLDERRKRIYYAQIIKEPNSSLSPASPQKLTNVLIAGILGLLIFGMLAFLLEYIEKQKLKLKK
ncbi:MAG: hypothetical protein KAR08_01180 [Candidatus Heimdallarchaeota archaeon]|nr:hypothetical protein [Candidatus Heimdallarchaeota archaeon]